VKILVTGGAGTLGRPVGEALARRHEVTLTDMVEGSSTLPFVPADLRDASATCEVVQGHDLVVHCAAIHPWKQYTDDEYLDCNIRGTWNVFSAAAASGIRRVVYTSSIAAMGYEPDGLDNLPMTEENKVCRPVENLYGVTKHVGEQFGRLFVHRHGMDITVLRPPHFVPGSEGELLHALRLLWCHMEVEDLVQAHVLAVESELPGFEVFIVAAPTPFTTADAAALRDDPVSVVRKYYPEAGELIAAQGLKLPPITHYYSIEKARRVLGFEPQYTFEAWLANRRGQRQ